MEYRCIIVGDPVVEPYALLRHLLYDPLGEAEMRGLRRESLLSIRSREIRNEQHTTQVAPPASIPERWTLTMSNPSMPSVDISIRFSVVTDPQKLLQVTLQGYRGKLSAEGLYDQHANGTASSGVAGFPLYQPHCIVVCFNPFSLRSFLRMRAEWAHFLDFTRQQHGNAASNNNSAYNPLSSDPSEQATKSLGDGFFSTAIDAYGGRAKIGGSLNSLRASSGEKLSSGSSLSTEHGADYTTAANAPHHGASGNHNTAPTVIFAATRLEFMRQAIESTPTIEVPTPSDIAKTAQEIHARAYVEVNTNLEDDVDALRLFIAQACVGELADTPVIGYEAVHGQRGESVRHAIEDIHANPDGDPVYSSEDDASDDSEGERNNSTTPKMSGSVLTKTDRTGASFHNSTSTVDPLRYPILSADGGKRETGKATERQKPERDRRRGKFHTTVWTYRHHNVTGRVFYVNRLSRKSQYHRPDDYDGREPTPPPPPSPKLGEDAANTDSEKSRSFLSESARQSSATSSTDVEGPSASSHSPASSTSPRKTVSNSSSSTSLSNPKEERPSDQNSDASSVATTEDDAAQLSSHFPPAAEETRRLMSPSAEDQLPPRPKTPPGKSRAGVDSTVCSASTESSPNDGDLSSTRVSSDRPLVSLVDVDYGGDLWDAEEVVKQMRSDRLKCHLTALRKQEAAVERLREQKGHLLSQKKMNAARAAHLDKLKEEVNAQQESVGVTAKKDEDVIDAEIVRLTLAIKALSDHFPSGDPVGPTSLTFPEVGLQDTARESEETHIPVLQSAELATYGANLEAAEAELEELMALLGERRQQFWSLRSDVLRVQADREAVTGQLDVLAAQNAALDAEEVTLQSALRDVETKLVTVQDAVNTRTLLQKSRVRERRQRHEGMPPLSKSAAGTSRSQSVDDLTSELMSLWERTESTGAALSTRKEAVGSLTLCPSEEHERLLLLCKKAASSIAGDLLISAQHMYHAGQCLTCMEELLPQLDALRCGQRSFLKKELEMAKDVMRDADHQGASMERSSPFGLSGGLGVQITQLRELLARFDAADKSVVANLTSRCRRAAGRTATAFSQMGDAMETRDATHKQVWLLWKWLHRSVEELSMEPASSSEDVPLRADAEMLLWGALRHAVTYGFAPRDSSVVDHDFLSLLHRRLRERGREAGGKENNFPQSLAEPASSLHV